MILINIHINIHLLNKFNFTNMENQENWKEIDYNFEEQLEYLALLTHIKKIKNNNEIKIRNL